MPKLTSNIEYERIKQQIQEARTLRKQGRTYEEIGEKVGLSSCTAHTYITHGEKLLQKIKPNQKTADPDWENITKRLYKLYEACGDSNTFSLALRVWKKEINSQTFNEYLENYFKDRGIGL